MEGELMIFKKETILSDNPAKESGCDSPDCRSNELNASEMSDPNPRKWAYYENYFKKTGKFPHAVVVDEHKNIRDGYISYLLAEKYGLHPEIVEVSSKDPVKKAVLGRHAVYVDGHYIPRKQHFYCWTYEKHRPVVPGDTVLAVTKKGLVPVYVDKIIYVRGREACEKHRRIKKHLSVFKMEGED